MRSFGHGEWEPKETALPTKLVKSLARHSPFRDYRLQLNDSMTDQSIGLSHASRHRCRKLDTTFGLTEMTGDVL
jgi:hypothetical protein